MPNRIIKESICTSEEIDQLTPFQEIFFYRLMVNCDDFGRFDARPKILKSRLFPLRDVKEDDVVEAVSALQRSDLITVYLVGGKPFLHLNSWEKHQQTRASKSKFPGPDDADGIQMESDDINGYQMISDDSKCPRNRNRNTIHDNRSRNIREEPLIDDDDAKELQSEQNRVLDAASDAGFVSSNSVMAALIRLYAQYGLERMLDGIAKCVKHGAPNLAYLEACLKGGPKKTKPVVSAQDFEQRDYSDVPDEMMNELAHEIAEFKAGGSA